MAADDIASVTAEDLQGAELALRQAVQAHGTTHPVVLEKLEAYVALAKKAGNTAQAEKLEEKAKILRKALGIESPTAAPSVAAPAAPPAPTPAPNPAPTASPEPATAAVSPSPQATATAVETQPDELRYVEKHLYNSKGEHIAVAFDGGLYTPFGKYLGRWDAELDAFIDDKGWYLGQIVEGDRLAKDPNWHYRLMNFGNIASAGNRTGWTRQPDTDRVMLPYGYNDISFAEE